MTVPQMTYDEQTQSMAANHYADDPFLLAVWSFPDPEQQVVRLVEIANMLAPTDDVMPFGWGPMPEYGYQFPSCLILLHTDEWNKVLAGELKLPAGWDLATKQFFPKPKSMVENRIAELEKELAAAKEELAGMQ